MVNFLRVRCNLGVPDSVFVFRVRDVGVPTPVLGDTVLFCVDVTPVDRVSMVNHLQIILDVVGSGTVVEVVTTSSEELLPVVLVNLEELIHVGRVGDEVGIVEDL